MLPDTSALGASDREAAIGTWLGRMVNEHISARVFAALVPQLMAAGVEHDDLARVAGMIGEELSHGVMCGAVVEALGGEAFAPLPALDAVPTHADAGPVEAALRNLLSICCLSETVAVALITAEAERTPVPELAEVLRVILADEVGHARFGWRLLGPLLERLDAESPEGRERLGGYLIGAFRHLREHELAHLPPRPAPSPEAERYGVCDGNEARALFFDTVETVIVPGLAAHGLPARVAWERSLA
ncbi:MAG: ferritin-like domain-containing protein [Deltaproteobacteria bacterium]|nr:MAG: ferritin-like domain-containing protein [Deltaproteobacteria bacterium]